MACFGDMLDSFPLSNGCLISLDFGHVSGVPVFEALPNGWLDIPNHFMKGRNDPFGSGLVVTLGGFVRLVLQSSPLICTGLHLSANSLHLSANSLQIALIRLHVLQCTMACFGDMLDSFPLSNGCLISLDFGHVSGVPVFEALPNGWLDIPNHFMKGRNEPFGSGLVVTLGDFVLLVLQSSSLINLHLSANSLHLSALVCK